MKFIDVHSHVQFVAYEADRDAVMMRAKEADTVMVNVGTQKDTSKAAVELAHKYPDIAWATIGLHPIHTSKSYHDKQELGGEGKDFTSRGEEFDYDYYLQLGKDSKVVGIGECGLDYYRLTEETKKKQHEVFIKQTELAKELKKPLMLHIRDAYADALSLLTTHYSLITTPGDVHFFAGDWNIAKQFLDLGFTLSFTGVITFPPRRARSSGEAGADQYDEVVKNTPLDMILTETDSPYITPVPLRGKRNEPVNVQYIVKRIAELKGLTVEEVQAAVVQNAKRVFGI